MPEYVTIDENFKKEVTDALNQYNTFIANNNYYINAKTKVAQPSLILHLPASSRGNLSVTPIWG